MIRAIVICIAVLASACGTFEDPSIVLDLRVLGMRTMVGDNLRPTDDPTIADQLVDVDLMMAPSAGDLLNQIEPTLVCALISDPGQERELRWSMTLCLPDGDDRCDRTQPFQQFANGVIGDPDLSDTAQQPCADLFPSITMLAMIQRAVGENPVDALGGVDLIVELQIGGIDAPRENDIYANKKLRIAPRIPADRRPNFNPRVDFLDGAELGISVSIPKRRCNDDGGSSFPVLDGGDVLTLYPVEPDTAREMYVVPTLDGRTAMLTETLTYQWLASHGSWSDETTGGGHDILGNVSLLGSDWRAPAVDRELLVSIWMIQRDERYGVSWFETCILVVP